MTATTTAEALFRAILVTPGDDLARLVFADWLEENDVPTTTYGRGFVYADGNGNAERAREIRHQCQYGGVTYAKRLQYNRQSPILRFLNDLPGEWEEVEIRRGFVSAVSCRLADWWGGECPQCRGQRLVERPKPTSGAGGQGWMLDDCPLCKAEGQLPAHGPRIVAEQPVETLTITDQSPYPGELRSNRNRQAWFDPDVPFGDSPRTQNLPREIFLSLEGFRNNGAHPDRVRWYGSTAAALSALSHALLNWARREAGLPPLPDTR